MSTFTTKKSSRGFTLMETVVTIGLIGILLSIFSSIFLSLRATRSTMLYRQASFYLEEALESLRTIPYSTLTTRTNGAILGVSVNRGDWGAAVVAAAPTSPNALRLTAAQAARGDETGLIILPGNYRRNFTYEASIMVENASPVGWGTALVFGYHDSENFYRLRLNANGIAVDESVNGTITTLWSQSVTHNKNTWYTLRVVGSSGAYTVSKNGSTLTTVTDATLEQGDLAIMSTGAAIVNADNVAVTESSTTTTWNFDTTTIGTIPSDWTRYSYLDLPSGTATLSLSNFQNDMQLKLATVVVQWIENNNTHRVTGSTVIRQ